MTAAAMRQGGPAAGAGVVFEDWHDLFREFAAFEAVGADDVLAAILPLMRQTLELHEAGRVAPLGGVEALSAHRGRLFFGPGAGSAPADGGARVFTLQGMAGALDLEGGRRPSAAAEPIALDAATLTEPAHLIGYRAWEQALGHHDALTDIYCLGALGASLAAALDLTDPRDLARFAKVRRTLTAANPRLHPAIARMLAKMTELDRRDREQDLATAIDRLEGYRRLRRSEPAPQIALTAEVGADAPPSPPTDASGALEVAPRAAVARDPETMRSRAILAELRGRLYDLSRRNRLIYYRPTASELDLTEASTPIVMRWDAIRPEQVFTLGSAPARELIAGKPVALGEVIRFDEMAHAAAALDKLRADDRRDRAELGLSQLRLIIGFLDWRNLKDDPATPIRSPLLLLPVALKKRRGVRDSFELRADGAEAEVNPTLRRYLQLLYGVELPRSVDLEQPDALLRLHRELAAEIAATEPSVSLELMEQPDLARLHKRATKRVDLYKRRTRATSALKKRFGDIDYCYDRTAYRPLGIELYRAYVAPPAPPRPPFGFTAPLDFDAPPPPSIPRAIDAAVAKEEGDYGAPFAWAVDLCALTLANLNYRRMSLVRDFDALLSGALERLRDAGSVAFDEVFADRAKPIAPPPALPPIAERLPVTTTDPTQDVAISRARLGESFVIQGPPGAGKSQTIANLIADQVAGGKRVLFVCEKRAAIDVVLRRLEAVGLAALSARVHDAQGDKKSFVQDLKDRFEAWAAGDGFDAPTAAISGAVEARRRAALVKIEGALAQLGALDRDMRASFEGEPAHEILTRAAATAGPMTLSEGERSRAPSLREWREGRDAALAVAEALARAGAEPVLARHPARFVSAEACADPALFERLTQALDQVGAHLQRMLEASNLAVWRGAAPLEAVFAQIDYAARLQPVALAGRLRVFDVTSQLAQALKRRVDDLALERGELMRAQERTHLWVEKLSDVEVDAALALARRHEGSWLGFLSRPWREAKAEVIRRCDLASLSIRPRIQDLLEDLQAEHDAAHQAQRRLREIGEELGLRDGAAALKLIEERDARAPCEGAGAAPLLEAVIADPAAAESRIQALAALKPAADAARETLGACFDGLDALPVDQAFAALSELRAHADALPAFGPALRALAEAPEAMRSALRRIDAPVEVIEHAILDHAAERALSLRPSLREADGAAIDAARATALAALDEFRAANAELTLERARLRFVRHLALTQRLELEMAPDEAAERRDFVESRRELERELAKTQRYRSIRDLLAGPAGLLIRDLKPIWMMSPLSVADVLPLEVGLFDLVIFDEASQVTAEAAAPSLFRAGQAIIVGDEKQMPPSAFFSAASPSAEEAADEEDAAPADDVDLSAVEAALQEDLDADSLLAQAGRTLPSTLLGWHYRSRAEELIAFSNAVFYGGKLITIPSQRRRRIAEPIQPTAPEAGAERWRDALERSLSFHHLGFGRFENRKNASEAEYVAELLRGVVLAKSGKTLGVVAFSEAQAAEIERAVDRLTKKDAKFRRLYEAEQEREVDGAFAGVFIKNLENVQGDERDLVIVSVGYGPDPNGKLRLNFGPINRDGGERRLNVLFTRAKTNLALVSSILADDIGSVCNDGALCLKSYLAYAAATSVGDAARARRVLALAGREAAAADVKPSPLAATIAEALTARGLVVEVGLGQSRFVVDLAARRPDDLDWRVAVLLDGPAHYAVADPGERYALRPAALEAFGWRTVTLLSTDWRRDPEAALARIEAALQA